MLHAVVSPPSHALWKSAAARAESLGTPEPCKNHFARSSHADGWSPWSQAFWKSVAARPESLGTPIPSRYRYARSTHASYFPPAQARSEEHTSELQSHS